MESLLGAIYCLFILCFADVVLVYATDYSSQECSSQYYRYNSKHTACIKKETTPNGEVNWNSMTDGDRSHIVETHNYFRGNVHVYNGGKRASNMLPMSYDRELENLAQLWAANCMFAHDEFSQRYIPGKYSTGQNLALGSISWEATMNLWHSEVKNFVYGEEPKSLQAIGHYTQMVWAESTRIGCGVQMCNGSTPFYVCNYGPAGNMANRIYEPYKVGKAEEDCPTKHNKTSGLCECAQSVCYNEGVVDTKSCTCRCPRATWLQQDSCAMKCGSAKDLPMCVKWGPSYCHLYSNVQVEYCPYMCNICTDPGLLPPPTLRVTSTQATSLDVSGLSIRPITTPTTEVSIIGDTTEQVLGYCEKEEPALCGQPNTKTGYLPKSVCLQASTASICPAMCNLCTARTCRDYSENSYNIGESWINMHGRFTCTSAGVRFERGCQTENRKDIVPLGYSRIIEYENHTYNCQCEQEDEEEKDLQRLHCIPIQPEESVRIARKPCNRADSARCGLPRPVGRYWLKSHCKLKVVRRLCPAMCKLCSATKCRRYTSADVVELGVELSDQKNNMFVCTTSGWTIGPPITIESTNHSASASRILKFYGISSAPKATQVQSSSVELPPTSTPRATTVMTTTLSTSTVTSTRTSAATTSSTTSRATTPSITTSSTTTPSTAAPSTATPSTAAPSTTTPSTATPSTTAAIAIRSPPSTATTASIQSVIKAFADSYNDPYADDYLDSEERSEGYEDVIGGSYIVDIISGVAVESRDDDDSSLGVEEGGSGFIQEFVDLPAFDTEEEDVVELTVQATTFIPPYITTIHSSAVSTSTSTTTPSKGTPTTPSTTTPSTTTPSTTTPSTTTSSTTTSSTTTPSTTTPSTTTPSTTTPSTTTPSTTTPSTTTPSTTTPSTTTSSTTNPSTTTPSTTTPSTTTSSTTTPNATTPSTTTPSTTTTPTASTPTIPTAQRNSKLVKVTASTYRIGSQGLSILQPRVNLVETIFPNKSASCLMPDQAYCNQPLPGNTSLTFTPDQCHINALVCPGMCGLCKVTQCQDYSKQLYEIGESWHSKYARLTCNATGVVSERGCYYELLRRFIAAGETLQHEDGFLSHTCVCNVFYSSYRWSHDLQCNTTVNTDQRITVPATRDECLVADNYRCTDPYYTVSDCQSIHVSTICPALCSKCKATQCKDTSSNLHNVGDSWVSTFGKVTCTQSGMKTVRGCRLSQLNVFIEVDSKYSYTSSGVVYTCLCEKTSEYRYQLTCEGQRRRGSDSLFNRISTTITVPTTTPASIPKPRCRKLDNPRCGQYDVDFWKVEMCTSDSKAWRLFMRKACSALCGVCRAHMCRGYDTRAYRVGQTWTAHNVEHTCTVNGIKF